MVSTDVILESFRALVLLILVVYLWHLGKRKNFVITAGWRFIQLGFLLILFGSFLDITDNFDSLNPYIVFGDTETEAFLEKVVGYLAGFIFLTIGLVKWGPTVERLMGETANRKKAEEAKQVSEKRFVDFSGAASDWLWEMGPDLRFTFFSDRLSEVLGIPDDAFIGKRRGEHVEPIVESDVWKNHLDTLNAHEPFNDFEYGFERPDGKIVFVRVSGVPILGDDGEFLGYRGTSTDITEQKLSEEALRQSEQRFRYFYELIPDVFMITDMDDATCVSVNDEFYRVTGYGPDEVIGQSTVHLNLWKNAKDREKLVSGLAKDGFVKNLSAEFRKKDGSYWPGLMTAGYILHDGRRHILSSTKDLTDEKGTEEALRRSQKMEAVGQLTGGIAHDFNNLLSIIIGNLELVKGNIENNEKTSTRIGRALTGAKRGADLTRSLLQFSRKEAHHDTIASLNDLIQDMTSLLRKSLTATINLKFEMAEDLWPTVVDHGDFSDAFINLVLNARDAMPQGGELLIKTSNTRLMDEHIFTNRDAKPGDYVRLDIFDSGKGMAPDIVEQIFEPFFTTKQRDRGTGLGLSMVYGFVQRSRGDISVHSEPAHGSTFCIYLPRAKTDAVDEIAEEKVDLDIPGGDETILVVEDENDLLETIKEHLASLGYKVHAATDAESALCLLDGDNDIDLLFSDIVMPGGINGFELADRATGMKPSLKVLMASGLTNMDALSRSGVHITEKEKKHLISELLQKPYDLDMLAIRVRRILDGEMTV